MSDRRPPSKFVTTFAEYQWCDTCDCYHTVSKDGYWYDGPWALAHNVAPVWVAEDYQWFDDDAGIGSATSLGAENTAISAAVGATIRLRVNVGEAASAAGSGLHTGGWTLQFSVDGGTWTPLGAASTVRYFDSTHLTNGTVLAVANYVLNYSGSEVQRDWGDECEDGVSDASNEWSNDYCEIEYTVDLNTVSAGSQVTFRVLAPDGTSAVTFTNVPTVNVTADVTREPLLEELDLDGKLPTATIANLREPPIDELALTGILPISSIGETREPPIDELALSGTIPTAAVNNIVTPGIDELVIAEQTPTLDVPKVIEIPTGILNIWKYVGLKLDGQPLSIDVSAGDNTELPLLGTLTIGEQAPTTVVANLTEPDNDTLAFSGKVPTVIVGEVELPTADTLELSGIAPSTIVANVVLPDTDELVIAEQTPTRTVGQTRTPDTDALDLTGILPTAPVSHITLPATVTLTIDEKTPDTGDAVTRSPDTDPLALTGTTPITVVGNVAAPDADTLVLDGKQPSLGGSITREPDTDTLALSGIAPTTVVNNIAIPDTDALVIAEQTPTVVADGIELPTADTLVLAGQTPTVQYNRVIEIGSDTLTLTGYAESQTVISVPTGSLNIYKYIGLKLDGFPPSVSIGESVLPSVGSLLLGGATPNLNITVAPTVGALTISEATPLIARALTVPTGALTLQGYDLVDQDTIVIPVGALTLSGQNVTLKGVEQAGTGSLTLSGQVPTVDYAQSPDPITDALSITGTAPAAVISGEPTPATTTLSFNADPPQVGVDSIVVLNGSLVLSGTAPAGTVKAFPTLGSDSLSLSGIAPSVAISDAPQTVSPSTAFLILESRIAVVEPIPTVLSLSGNPVTIFYRDGVLIENPNATTAVPSNYEQCDFSGFRQLPGSLKLTWNKHAVRKKSWEERHPQDVLQNVPERQKGSKRPEQPDTFIDTLYPDGVDQDDL